MANMHKLPVRGLRGIPDDELARFDAAAREAGYDRSSLTRALWRWWVGEPGAELPTRPVDVTAAQDE